MSSEIIEWHARAYDPVGWKWYDAAPNDHAAKPYFYKHAIERSRVAILSLRQPDRLMIEAGAAKHYGNDEMGLIDFHQQAIDIFNAMIEKAATFQLD